jgi:hypothetical protein
MSDNTQLTSASGYDTKRMIFSDPQGGTIPDSKPQIAYKRITIQSRNEDGTTGDLIFPTSQLFSFGISENTNPETGKVNGYVMPLCLWNRDGASKEEKGWSDTFDNVIEACKEHLIAHREEIDQYDLALSDLKKFNPLYWKREKGKIVDGTGPTLYAKLIVSKKQNKIVTMFYDYNGDPIDPLNLLGKYCYSKAAVKIESIFIGNKISMQIKLYECECKLMDTGMKRLMKRPEGQKRVLTSNVSRPLDDDKDDKDDKDENIPSDDNASIKDSDDDEPTPPTVKKTSQKKIVKRRVKKVVKKEDE